MNHHIATQLRNNILFIPEYAKTNTARESLAHAAAANLLSYGILVNPEYLTGVNKDYLTEINTTARSLRGADRHWGTLFPNFPEGVRKSNQLGLIINQIVHYWSFGTLRPAQHDDARNTLPVDEMLNGAVRVEVIDDFDKIINIVIEKVNENRAMQADFVNFLEFVLNNATTEQQQRILASTKNAKFKENLSLLHFALMQHVRKTHGRTQEQAREAINQTVLDILPTITNADVMLRLLLSAYVFTEEVTGDRLIDTATRLVNLDPLPRGTKTAPISNKVRRAIVNHLDKVIRFKEFPADVFLERKALWRRILSSIHAFDVKTGDKQRYLLDALFENNKNYVTFNAMVEAGLAGENTPAALEMLAKLAPGLLLRKVVAFAERDFATTFVAVDYALTNKQVPVATLLGAINAVRASCVAGASFRRIAGMTTQKVETELRLTKEQAESLESVIVQKGLVPALKNVSAPQGTVGVSGATMPVPLSLASRSNTATDRARLEQGERCTIEGEGSTLRMFVHWFNSENSQVDIDLGMALLDENFEPLDVWSYDNVYSGYYGRHGVNDIVTFSGDITNAPYPDGASEFYDVDMVGFKAKYPTGRYLVMSLTVYSGGRIDTIGHFAGVMRRGKTQSGEVFDARTVMSGSRSGVKSRLALPLAVDIDTAELIWLDTDTGMTSLYASATELQDEISSALKDIVNTDKFSVHELLTLWAQAHGAQVDDAVAVDMSQVTQLL